MKYVFLMVAMAAASGSDGDRDPRFNQNDELIRPENYREWIYLTSGLGMSYGRPSNAKNPPFDNVFVHPAAYKAFMATGKWPDKTMFILEIRSSMSHSSINKAGHFQSDMLSIDAAVKDETRFKEKWAYFNFNPDGSGLKSSVKPFAGDSACNV